MQPVLRPVEPEDAAPARIGGTPAVPRRRTLGIVASLVVWVLGTAGLATWYLYTLAADQFASRIAFSVRSNDSAAPLEIFGAITQLGSSSVQADGAVIYDFVQSQQIVEEVRAILPLEEMFNRPAGDWIFALGQDQPIEDIVDYWNWMVDVAMDPASGILTVEVRAFAPDEATQLADAILTASARLVNQLSEEARADAVRYAKLELAEAEARMRKIRARLRAFRDAEQEVDPTQNAGAAMGLVATLEEDLARAQVQLDTLRGALDPAAPRALALRRRIATLEARIAKERTRLGSGERTMADTARPLSAIVGDFEELLVDRELAEQAYTLALSTYEQAQAEARRRHRYVAAHIRPTLSEEAEYPDRPLWIGGVFLLALLSWAIVVLGAFNVADRR